MEFNVSIVHLDNNLCMLIIFHFITLFELMIISILQEVLKSTRVQLEKELTMGCILSVQDLPSFRMLKR
jgi:hypothetical protein